MKGDRITGRKRRFGAAGVINILATNLLLQLLLSSQIVSTGVATLAGQVFNGCFGYAIYGKWVFRSDSTRKLRSGLLYGLMMLTLWLSNSAGIELISSGYSALNRNIAALIMIAPLAALSFLFQKHIIFKPVSQA